MDQSYFDLHVTETMDSLCSYYDSKYLVFPAPCLRVKSTVCLLARTKRFHNPRKNMG